VDARLRFVECYDRAVLRPWRVATSVSIAAVVAVACASFEGPGSDGPALADSGSDADVDADLPDSGPVERCPAPPVVRSPCVDSFLACTRKRLFQPPGTAHPHGLAVDDEFAYMLAQPRTSEGYNGNALADLWRVQLSTGQGDLIGRGLGAARAVLIHDGSVYWSETSTTTGITVVRRLPRTAPACSASCAPSELVADGLAGAVWSIVAVRSDVLYAVEGDGALKHIDLASSLPAPARTIARVPAYPVLAVARDQAFFGSLVDRLVYRILESARDGGIVGMFEPFDAGDPGTSALATNCRNVYALDGRKRVTRQPVDAIEGSFQPTGAALPAGFSNFATAVDSRFVYFGGANSGGLYRFDVQNDRVDPLVENVSAWSLAVSEKLVAYAEHGRGAADANVDVGAIFLLEK
jgi:hypothetical protein